MSQRLEGEPPAMEVFFMLLAVYVVTMVLARGAGMLFRDPLLPPRIARALALVMMGCGLVLFVGVGSQTDSDAQGIALAGVFIAFLGLSLPCWAAYFLLSRSVPKTGENEGPGFSKR